MNLKLVYRVLRRISDWTVYGFYSEVHVEGQENVPERGPVIIAANHHNEIIDVATLAVTIPHNRHVSFWAKSTLFKYPIARQILASSGAIPVNRNPNSANGSGTSRASLFESSTLALASGEVIGVFSEGASYTEPTIVQVMSGTAWAAVEYARWQREHKLEAEADLVVVPVGLVYTEKATFNSRVRVQYGAPISMADYAEELFDVPEGANADDVAYKVVRKITARIQEQLFAMTINASDWETMYAAETLRAVLYDDQSKIHLRNWTILTQKLVDLLSAEKPSERLLEAKSSLVQYFSLLHYTGLSHHDLPSLPASASRLRFLLNLGLPSLSTVLLTPLYAPALLLHIPACLFGELTLRVFSKREEPEGFAQYRAVGGGVGAAMGAARVLAKVPWRGVFRWAFGSSWRDRIPVRGKLSHAIAYLMAGWVMVRYYGLLAPGLHYRLKRAVSSCRLLLGVLLPRSKVDVAPYTKLPPPPPSNAFIRRHKDNVEFWDKKEKELKRVAPPPVAGRKLVRAVLEQREETGRVVKGVLEELAYHDDLIRTIA